MAKDWSQVVPTSPLHLALFGEPQKGRCHGHITNPVVTQMGACESWGLWIFKKGLPN